jgi:hypothetical protein
MTAALTIHLRVQVVKTTFQARTDRRAINPNLLRRTEIVATRERGDVGSSMGNDIERHWKRRAITRHIDYSK